MQATNFVSFRNVFENIRWAGKALLWYFITACGNPCLKASPSPPPGLTSSSCFRTSIKLRFRGKLKMPFMKLKALALSLCKSIYKRLLREWACGCACGRGWVGCVCVGMTCSLVALISQSSREGSTGSFITAIAWN